ncbi:MAG: hypothetical protein HQ551_05695 [Desulfobacteraceae bacterium]|nr:hypothetical protein [Desulfobacteraceae bacterium]
MKSVITKTIIFVILLFIVLVILKHKELIDSPGSYFIGICALVVGFAPRIISYDLRPILDVDFDPAKREFKHNMLFGILEEVCDPITHEEYRIYRPAFNSRVCIRNNGINPARKAQARIERLKIFDKNRNLVEEVLYHPSTIKWSGEKDYLPVDIMGKSYYFLDLFLVINETKEEIINFNKRLGKETIKEKTEDAEYSNEIYWNVWIDLSYPRGVRDKYKWEGHFELTFLVFSENSNQLKFKASIDWEKEKWNNPSIDVIKVSNVRLGSCM